MQLGEPIMKILNKLYEPSSIVEAKFKRYDLVFKTDETGRPVLLFMGKKNENGTVIGERYSRRLKFDINGVVVKDHWEHKGKAS